MAGSVATFFYIQTTGSRESLATRYPWQGELGDVGHGGLFLEGLSHACEAEFAGGRGWGV